MLQSYDQQGYLIYCPFCHNYQRNVDVVFLRRKLPKIEAKRFLNLVSCFIPNNVIERCSLKLLMSSLHYILFCWIF